MSNEIEIRNPGELAPYSPSQPLAPAPEEWGTTELSEYTQHPGGGGQTIFGQPLPPGITAAQATEAYKQLGAVFVSDFMRLGHGVTNSQKAVSWFLNALSNPPAKQRKLHNYNLFEHTDDPIFQAFANYAAANNFSAKFVADACWWVTEASKRLTELDTKKVGTHAQGSAPQTSGGRPDDLDTATYNALYDHNEKMKPYTEGILREKWGHAYEANRRTTDAYFQSLSDVEKRHFDQFLDNGLHALNDPTVIFKLHGQAIGINNIPRGGAELANEINMMHHVMKNNRRQWLADERMQSRYRELIRIRDGG